MKNLAKETIDLITLIGGCKSIREVRKVMDVKGDAVEKLAYEKLTNKK